MEPSTTPGDRGRAGARGFTLLELITVVALSLPTAVVAHDAPSPDPPADGELAFVIDVIDGALFMVMAGQTHRELAKRGVELLNGAGANILGAVVNNLTEVLPYYYDQKYYGYERSGRK